MTILKVFFKATVMFLLIGVAITLIFPVLLPIFGMITGGDGRGKHD
jgi:hypothetical protein